MCVKNANSNTEITEPIGACNPLVNDPSGSADFNPLRLGMRAFKDGVSRSGLELAIFTGLISGEFQYV